MDAEVFGSLVRAHPSFVFFFNDTATTEIYTLPYTTLFRSGPARALAGVVAQSCRRRVPGLYPLRTGSARDRKSTRLNSSHGYISYAVFCLKKKKTQNYAYFADRIECKAGLHVLRDLYMSLP